MCGFSKGSNSECGKACLPLAHNVDQQTKLMLGDQSAHGFGCDKREPASHLSVTGRKEWLYSPSVMSSRRPPDWFSYQSQVGCGLIDLPFLRCG